MITKSKNMPILTVKYTLLLEGIIQFKIKTKTHLTNTQHNPNIHRANSGLRSNIRTITLVSMPKKD